MNILLWVLQILLALHTLMGAIWKFSQSAEQTMPALKVILPGVWLAMSVMEILCSLGLILPAFSKRLAFLAPISAAFIGAEMLLFSALYLSSGNPNHGPVYYWLVVAVICAVIGFGRFRRA